MKKLILTSILILIATMTFAQKSNIDFQAISQGTFAAKTVQGIRSMSDGEHYTVQERNKIVRYRYKDGAEVEVVFDGDQYEQIGDIFDYQFSADEIMMLFSTEREKIYRHSSSANFWVFNRQTGELKELSPHGKQQEATLSPNGKLAAFVRGNNLFVVRLSSMSEDQITTDGEQGKIINGIPDWVYEEEYSFSRAYEWSSYSDAIAFYRFDETRVKEYSMNTFNGRLYPKNFNFKYPKAGEENALVEIKVYDVLKNKTIEINIGEERDQYIPRIEWSGRPSELVIHRLNRQQNNYQMLFADTQSGESKTIYTEKDHRYIDRIDESKVHFLPDEKYFIVMNETKGWRHLYLYDMEGKLIQQITDGKWEVTALNGIDTRRNRLYYTSTEVSTLGRDLYVVEFGKNVRANYKKRQLTAGDGYYISDMSSGAKYYISTFSNSTTPTKVTLHSADGVLLRQLEDNSELVAELENWQLPTKEFFTLEINGEILNAYILKPVNFDPTKKYPLFMTQYSGPGSQQVLNNWRITWELSLLNEGYLVACVDGRGTGAKGEAFRKVTYGDLGRVEAIDQIDAAKWFARQPYIDAERIGIYGWSYGGFMALNCILKGSDIFATAVAVAPVTSWRYYDTIYTELYNGLPQTNPKGYDLNSPVHFADNLKGKLLIAHGTADDNVHVQNSYDMIEQLVKRNKEFEWVIYPDKDHSMGSAYNHLINKIIDFVKENL